MVTAKRTPVRSQYRKPTVSHFLLKYIQTHFLHRELRSILSSFQLTLDTIAQIKCTPSTSE